MKKPSERIEELVRAQRTLDGKDPDKQLYSYEERAIIQWLDEKFYENPDSHEKRPPNLS